MSTSMDLQAGQKSSLDELGFSRRPIGDEYRILTIMTEAIWRTSESVSDADNENKLRRRALIGGSIRCAEQVLEKLREAGYHIVRDQG